MRVLTTARRPVFFLCAILIFACIGHGSLMAQTSKVVKGTIYEKVTSSHLAGVNVSVKGANKVVTTNANGEFSIEVKNTDVLVFSFAGYLTSEVVVGSKMVINETLSPVDDLEEVVVVGYGVQRKENLTGAVSRVDGKTLENRPVSNVASGLQGISPGLTITRSYGQPGSEAIQVQVRGATSANGHVNPLLIVDGVSSPIFTLQTMNPNDIESISVLKDASASAIYGAQAAGGVILVTTKAGKAGKTRFEYSSLFGFDMPQNVPRRVSLLEEAEYDNLASINSGAAAPYGAIDLQRIRDGIPYVIHPTDTTQYIWYNQKDKIKEQLRSSSPRHSHNLSAAGGSDKLNFLVSFGYYDKQGVFRFGPDQMKRYNARFNLGAQLTRHISLTSRISYMAQDEDAPSQSTNGVSLLMYAYRTRLRYPVLSPEGKYPFGARSATAFMKEGGYSDYKRNFLDGVFTLKIADIVKGLQLRAVYGHVYRIGDREQFFRTFELWDRFKPRVFEHNPNFFQRTKELTLNSNLQFIADYNLRLGKKHNFQTMVGYQWEDQRSESLVTRATTLASNTTPSLNLGDNTTKIATETINTYAYQSVFGRFNYNYDNKYLFEASFRVDESSRLAPALRRKSFPSASVGWNMHKEKWFANALPFVSEFKLRASWGQLGSALGNIGAYDYVNLITSNSDLVLGLPEKRTTYYYQNSVASSSLSWETIETTNGGMDLGLFKNKLRISADYYVKFNKNMRTPLQVPATFGIASPRINNGELKSWGWELETLYRDRIGKNITYSLGINISDNQNKLVSYAGQKVIVPGVVGILEGYSLNSIWGYQTDGYFQTKEEADNWAFQNSRSGAGDVRYLDLDKDDRITAGSGTPENHGDLVYLGTNQPRYQFGITGSIAWKGIDLSFFFQGVAKRKFYSTVDAIAPLVVATSMPLSVHMDYWRQDNPNALFPRPYRASNHNYLPSDKWLLNGKYMRLKNIQLGYALPSQLISKLKLRAVRIFFTGEDLFTVSGMGPFNKVMNPESANNAGADYPFFSSASMGINISF